MIYLLIALGGAAGSVLRYVIGGIAGAAVERATNVNFTVSVGTVVPRTVRVVAVPDVIVEVHPEWRAYRYFVVDDQIIIVDDGFRIIAVFTV